MHFEDRFVIAAPVDRVWQFITNPSDFVKAVPDLQRHEIKDDRHFSIDFKMGLGMIRGTIKMNFEFKELQPKSLIKLAGKGSGLQSTADLTITLNLAPHEAGTQVSWSADLIVAGTAMSIGARFIEPTTRAKVTEIVGGIKKAMEN
ncbi:MAG: carbon monoxide dehydrogenase subunit G [Nitrososphaerota archaeon]|nr:carbon monoxide dehydrogenase subunit G [Nitrososphaerota archaeon]